MANEQIDGRDEDLQAEEILELNEAPPVEDNAPKGYDDYVAQAEQPQEEQAETEDLPDKYRGKSIQDIISMHQNAEKLLGKQSSEVGELRKVVDDFIKTQTVTQQQAPTPPVETELDDVDFFEDPKKAVNQLLENHPTVKQSREMAIRLAQQEAVAQIK